MIAIYTRLSKEDDASNSIKNQLREGTTFAESKGLEYKIYDEGEGLSGALGLDDRPQLQKLYEDIIDGKISIVWFRDSNRLARNEYLYHQFIDLFKKYKVEIYFADKLFDLQNPSMLAMESIKATFNALKVIEQSLATKKAIKSRLERGLSQGATPFGYMKDKNQVIVINPKESPIVKQIFRMSLDNIGLNPIADKLNELGIPTRRVSTKWNPATIHQMLVNPYYTGVRTYANIDYKVPSIIDSTLFEKVVANLKNNSNNSGVTTYHKYLLSKIIFCSKCGKRCSGKQTKQSYKGEVIINQFYTCISVRSQSERCGNRAIKLEILDNLIWSKFIREGRLKRLINSHFNESKSNNTITIISDKIKSLQTSLNSLKKDKNRLLDLALNGVLSNDDIKSKMESIKQSISKTERRIENNQEKLKMYESDISTNELNDIGLDMDYQNKRDIIKKFIKRIELDYDRDISHYFIKIEFNVPDMKPITYVMPSNKHYAHEYPVKEHSNVDLIIFNDKMIKQYKEGKVNVKLLMGTKKDFE